MSKTQTVAILTGASRGLGAALARALLDDGTYVVTLARRHSPELDDHARAQQASVQQVQVDLADPQAASRVAHTVCASLPAGAQRYWLINNAGALAPVARADALSDGAAIAAAFNLNVVAPVVLTARFLAAPQTWPAQRRVLNISSGAGRNPRAGWSVYCASKAALDMATQVVALEQVDGEATAARLVSLAPGIVDTDMQAHIRASDPAHFPTRALFQAFYDDGQLSAPATVARRIIVFLRRDDFGSQPLDNPVLADIRDYD